MFAKKSIDLKRSAKVDWINHKTGDAPLEVGTISTAAGDITLMNNSVINGDVIVGVGGDPPSTPRQMTLDIAGNFTEIP